MKKGDFLWSAYRITEKQKAGKARNIKEKQLKNSRNTVSKQLVELRSSPNDNYISFEETNLHRLYSAPPAGFSCGRFFVYEKIY